MSKINEKIDLARRELLDLSLKNPLLNYKLRVSSGLEFPYLNAPDVFNYLVNENKKSYFSLEKTSNPSRLFVDMTDKQMHSKLLGTFRSAKMYMEEKGANILFLALGFLRWSEDGENFYRAPLILVPVDLKKMPSQEKFYLEYSGEDVRVNVSLITKMSNDFNIDISYEHDDEITGIDEYIRKVDEAVSLSPHHDWTVDTTSGAFDFFSYAKFLMYKDLDLLQWNDDQKIDNEMLKKLFVTDFSEKMPKSIDSSEFAPYKIYNVVDADSSQAQVIYDIAKGRNMVIQGPPGTGKSQTITNIIASSIANGKSVLFVAEKRAALDVVKNRLEKIGLVDLVLELHSQKTNKNDVIKSIENTVNLGSPKVHSDEMLKNKYENVRNEIDEYRNILNDFLGKSQLSLVEVYGNALKIKDKIEKEGLRLPRIHISDEIAEWSDSEFEKKLNLVKEYIALLKFIGKIDKHPFFGVELYECLPYEQVTIKERIFDLEDGLNSLVSVVNEIGSIFSNKSTNNIIEAGRLINSIELADKYRELSQINCQDTFLYSHYEFLEDIIKIAKELQTQKKNLSLYRENAYLDYKIFIYDYETYNSKSEEVDKESLKEELATYMADGKYSKTDLTTFYHLCLEIKKVLDNDVMLKLLFKGLYNGIWDTNWNLIKKLCVQAHKFMQEIFNYSVIPQTKNVISESETLDKLLELKEEYFERRKYFEDRLIDFIKTTKFNYIKRFNYYEWYMDMPFADLKKVIFAWKNNVDSIVEIVRYNDLTAKFYSSGLKNLLSYYLQSSKYEHLDDILSYEYYDALINYAYSKYPYLSQFKEYKFERTIENFREMDTKLMVENIKFILKEHYEKMPKLNEQSTQMGVLRRELLKKKNQMPIRKLFRNAGDIIQKIKPVFMMSPISVASFLPPKAMVFDIVVFDEASQVRPVEAFGSLLRARQLVVVGDSKQLPPTTFFDTLTTKNEQIDDADYDVVNMESILSLLLAKNIPQRTLSWHYRSKNQSLISFSNNEFYNQTLKVFPSVYDKDPNQGLVYRHVPDSVYERGGSRTNVIEAREVIKAVFEHVEKNPNMSIGVVSFSLAQQEELYRQFDFQLKKHNSDKIAEYFDSNKNESFFIKNLESVQGDERDVIFISVGYGFDAERKVSMDFGPLNKEGGERRLNVLITRAKYKCIVFSNLTSHDINLSKTSAIGVIALKRFLEYAQNRKIFSSKNLETTSDSFIDYLHSQLIDYGYEVDRNIGASAGVDLAVYDKELGRFTVGIECDGGVYKDIEVTTDRERIRKNVLRNLGWKIYHVWAPDFYRNPRNEFVKLLDFIEESKKENLDFMIQSKNISFERRQSRKLEEVKSFQIYKEYSGPKSRADVLNNDTSLKVLISRVLDDESPINIHALKKQLMFITNVTKLTEEQSNRIQFIIISDHSFEFRNDFVYKKGQKDFDVRNREKINKYFKKAEYISDEEYLSYVYMVLANGEAATREEVYKIMPDFFGISKSRYAFEKINGILDNLIASGKVYIEDGMLFLNVSLNGPLSLEDAIVKQDSPDEENIEDATMDEDNIENIDNLNMEFVTDNQE